MKPLKATGLIALVCALVSSAPGAQIMLNATSVIGGSGQWPGSNYDDPYAYNTLNVVNQQTGAISEPGPGGYWLGRENTLTNTGFLNEYFVLDLGAPYFIDQIDLFNTHNQTANDRATKNFTILGSNSVNLIDANVDYDLSGATTLLTGTLTFQTSASDPIDPDVFTSGNGLATGTAYRYLKFVANDFYTPNGPFNPQGSGLNEVRVFGTPEPSRVLLVLAGLGACLLRQRRRT